MEGEASVREPQILQNFRKHWQVVTDDDNLTLHGFRRFKTTHLLNLRFLEDEIAELDHSIYQAGLSLGMDPSPTDRLGLKHCKRDANIPKLNEIINKQMVLRLRDLLKQYDEALIAFNQVMAMETFSLLDNEKLSSLRTDLSLYEIYKTRLLRVDLGARSRTDPFQRRLHKWLRAFRYRRISQRSQRNPEACQGIGGYQWSNQNTVLIAGIVGRVVTAIATAVFLITPLAVLSYESFRSTQLVVVSVFILVFSFLVAVTLKISNFEMMVVSAAYAAVLSTFIS